MFPLVFTDDITESHPLQLDQPTDACYPSNNRSPSANSVDMTRPQKQSSVTSHTPATPRGTCLTLNDHDRIRQFLQEFTFRGLLPHVEKNIRQLNDQVDAHLEFIPHANDFLLCSGSCQEFLVCVAIFTIKTSFFIALQDLHHIHV